MAWIPAFVESGNLEAARRAGEYYARFDTWYGAPEDVDLAPTSEDGYAAVMAFVALEDWETARRAADWMLTFRYSYDVDFAPDTTLGEYDFRSLGADQASPANQHLHAFGLDLPARSSCGSASRTARPRCSISSASASSSRGTTATSARMRGMAAERYLQTDCFGPKGSVDPLSHAWSIGVLLYACEALL